MSSRPELKLDWCSHEAAKYAVEHWHYSRSMPTPPIVKVGAWEAGKFIGCVLFSRGANNNLCKSYGLQQTGVCELTRVALRDHATPVSRIVAIALRFLKNHSPGLRLCVSYADPNVGHHGGIYQAGNWIYSGRTGTDFKARSPDGRIWHSRQVSRTGVKRQFGQMRRVFRHDECDIIPLEGKHRYLMPLDDEMREKILPLAKPYPKRERGVDSDTPGHQPGEGGAHPTRSLRMSAAGGQRSDHMMGVTGGSHATTKDGR